MIRLLMIFAMFASPTFADVDRLVAQTRQDFPEIPRVQQVASLDGLCGGEAIGPGVYCPSERRIFLVQSGGSETVYALAHLYGHALQVTYGVADIALAAIRSDRSREAELRGMVTRQVECLAGVLVARAGLSVPPLDQIFAQEPMTGSHWGANPVRNGPRVTIGLAARAEWFAIGQRARDPSACSVGEMSADLIVRADFSQR